MQGRGKEGAPGVSPSAWILALQCLQASAFLPAKSSSIQHVFIEHLPCARSPLPSKRGAQIPESLRNEGRSPGGLRQGGPPQRAEDEDRLEGADWVRVRTRQGSEFSAPLHSAVSVTVGGSAQTDNRAVQLQSECQYVLIGIQSSFIQSFFIL